MDRKKIFIRAWEIRRNAAEEIGCNVMKVIFSVCLQIAWKEVKMEEKQMELEFERESEKKKVRAYIAANVHTLGSLVAKQLTCQKIHPWFNDVRCRALILELMEKKDPKKVYGGLGGEGIAWAIMIVLERLNVINENNRKYFEVKK